jgi:hypothetical protein
VVKQTLLSGCPETYGTFSSSSTQYEPVTEHQRIGTGAGIEFEKEWRTSDGRVKRWSYSSMVYAPRKKY